MTLEELYHLHNGQVQLIGIGWHKAKPAQELQVGDTLVWNYGNTSTFVGFGKTTRTQIEIITRINGKEYTRRVGQKRLIAYK